MNRTIAIIAALLFAATSLVSSQPVLRAERSEEHTSELQSLRHLVCRLLLEKKKKKNITHTQNIKLKKNNEDRCSKASGSSNDVRKYFSDVSCDKPHTNREHQS